MGREKYWGGGGGGGGVKSTKKVGKQTPGCMSGVLHLFDFHPITLNSFFKPNSIVTQQDLITPTKGIEAPRNSLESETKNHIRGDDTSLSSEIKQEKFKFDIPTEIRLSTTSKDNKSSASQATDSPGGAKTPSLVARLMGLDLFPDSALSPVPSPSAASSAKSKSQSKMNKSRQIRLLDNEISGTRSLPDTPRISSARRSDVDASRFSLQINKENSFEESEYFGHRVRRDQKLRTKEIRNEEENKSPGHYARQIVKQVKENVSRRMGTDITNTSTTHSNEDKVVVDIQPHVTSIRYNTRNKAIQGEHSSTRIKKTKCLAKIEEDSKLPSARLRVQELKDKSISSSSDQIPPAPTLAPAPAPAPGTAATPLVKSKERKTDKCKKANCERFTQRKESSSKAGLNDMKSKKSPLEPKEASLSTTSAAHIHTQSRPSKQCSRLSSCSTSTPYKQQQPRTLKLLHDRDVSHTTNNPTGSAIEFRYVKEILICTGIKDTTPISFDKWFSPSHPLHPSTFHYLEQSLDLAIGSLKHQCNRKLMFALVDEILVTVLKPYLNIKPWLITRDSFSLCRKQITGKELRQKLWNEITSSPLAKCEVLEDIDNLIAKDLSKNIIEEEEREAVVIEIAKDILDTLVLETAMEMLSSYTNSSSVS